MAIHRLDYFDFIEKSLNHCKGRYYPKTIERNNAWSGGLALPEIAALAKTGDESLARTASKYLESYEGITLPETRKRKFLPGMSGAFPSVPDYLSERPDCMRQLSTVHNDMAPIRIYCTTICAAFRTPADMVNRHSAVLAMALLINRVRPVELYAVINTTRGKSGCIADILTIRIPSPPFSIGHAAVALAHPGFTRQMGYNYAQYHFGCDTTIPIPRGKDEYIKKTIDITPSDIFIPIAEDKSWDSTMDDPAAWVRHEVSKALGETVL